LKLNIKQRKELHKLYQTALKAVMEASDMVEPITYATHHKRKQVVVVGKLMNLQRELDQ